MCVWGVGVRSGRAMFSLQRQLFAQNEERLLAVVHVKSVKKTVKKRVRPKPPFTPTLPCLRSHG